MVRQRRGARCGQRAGWEHAAGCAAASHAAAAVSGGGFLFGLILISQSSQRLLKAKRNEFRDVHVGSFWWRSVRLVHSVGSV